MQMQDYVGEASRQRYQALEAAIRGYYECGVSLDRMRLVGPSDGSSTTLYVDDVARFTWSMRQ